MSSGALPLPCLLGLCKVLAKIELNKALVKLIQLHYLRVPKFSRTHQVTDLIDDQIHHHNFHNVHHHFQSNVSDK